MTSIERWLPVVGDARYEVSDLGNVRNANTGKPLRLLTNRYGYIYIAVYRDGKTRTMRVNRLVLTAFVGPCPPGMQSAHYNGIKADNRIENLRWATPRENVDDNHRLGVYGPSPTARLTQEIADELRTIPLRHGLAASLARKYGVSRRAMSNVLRGVSWVRESLSHPAPPAAGGVR